MPRETSRGTTYYIAREQWRIAALLIILCTGLVIILWLVDRTLTEPILPSLPQAPGVIEMAKKAISEQPWPWPLFAVLCIGIMAIALVYSVVDSLARALNVNVTLTNEGVVLRDWKRAHKTIPWDVIAGIAWRTQKGTRWLPTYQLLVARTDTTDPLPVMQEIAHSNAEQELTQLRDDIISRLELSEVPPEQVAALRPRILRFLSSGEDRIWRKSADNTTMDW